MLLLYIPLLFFIHAAIFLIPGLGLASLLYKRNYIEKLYVVPVAGIFACAFGYIAFWLYLANQRLGIIVSALLILTTIVVSVYGVFSEQYKKLLYVDIIIPLVLLLLVGFFYSSITYSCTITLKNQAASQQCDLSKTTFDNIIPQLFAQNVYSRQATQLIGDWQGSDRPPLQTGIILLQSPFTISRKLSTTSYQLLATLSQCLWVPAIWIVGRKLRLKSRQQAFLMAFCIFSGFFFFNSVFVWPKLLAGSLVLFAFALMFFESPTILRWSLAAIAAGLGFLAHSSVVFTLIPMAFLALLPRYRPPLKTMAVAGLIFLVLVTPWLVYQKTYDPPGDRLLKWHVGGVEQIDSRSVGQAIHDSYQKEGPRGVLRNKLSNVRTVFGKIPPESYLYTNNIWGKLRDAEFRYVVFGLGLLNIGWIILLRNRRRKDIDMSMVKVMIGVSMSALALWTFILFGPNITVIHAGSYTTMFLLFACLAALVTFLPPKLLKLVLLMHITYFIMVWVISVMFNGIIDLGMLFSAFFTFLVLLTVLYRIHRHQYGIPE